MLMWMIGVWTCCYHPHERVGHHASKATEMWSSMPSGFTHAEHLEAHSLQQARQVRLDKGGGLETPMEFRQTDL